MKWWKAWIVAAVLAIVVGWPWGVIIGAPFALWAGWSLIPRKVCGWCGRHFDSSDWCCDRCAQWHSDTPWDAA